MDGLRFYPGCGCKNKTEIRRIPISRMIERLDACFAQNDLSAAGRVLAYWRKEAVALGDLAGELSVVNEQLGYFRKINDASQGLEAVRRSLELLQLLQLDDDVSAATICLNAATTLKAFDQAKEAIELYNRVWTVYSEKLAPTDERLGCFYNNKALALTDLHRYSEAESCYQKAIAIMEQSENGIPDLAVTYVNLAHLYDVWFDDSESFTVACMEQVQQLLNSTQVLRDSYYAFVCTKCAPSCDYFGYFVFAQELRERAKEIYART